MTLVPTPDGRVLEVVDRGPAADRALLYHHGQPGAATVSPQLASACAEAGLRLVTYARPGYGDSTRRPDGTRPFTVADDIADITVVLDAVGVSDFVTLGWSGGGPRAIACAALLPNRCRGAVSLAGVAPKSGDPATGMGPAWFDGMAEDNVREYAASLEGEASLRPLIEAEAVGMAAMTGPEVAGAIGSLVSAVDVAALDGAMADWVAASFRDACRRGADGFVDDALVTMRPWGFELRAVTVPVHVWQGTQDRMVPFGHGAWLAEHVGGAVPHLVEGAGHISLWGAIRTILTDLTTG